MNNKKRYLKRKPRSKCERIIQKPDTTQMSTLNRELLISFKKFTDHNLENNTSEIIDVISNINRLYFEEVNIEKLSFQTKFNIFEGIFAILIEQNAVEVISINLIMDTFQLNRSKATCWYEVLRKSKLVPTFKAMIITNKINSLKKAYQFAIQSDN